MGYRIEYRLGSCTLQARVSGKSSLMHAKWIARDICREAERATVRQLLIDVRGLYDRLGTLSTLASGTCRAGTRRVAMVDSSDNERYHPFSEWAARRRGRELRYFEDAAAAIAWLEDGQA